MVARQFHGGHANLTYLLSFGGQEFVLRRPPFGKIAPGAHDMGREFRVLSRLYRHFSPAPRAFHLCEDKAIIGAPFVLLERRRGIVLRYEVGEHFSGMANVTERLSDALVRAEAALHRVDIEAAGLAGLGRPSGFAERQLAGWARRWALAKTEENAAMERVHQRLSAAVPAPQATAVIHNDLKFDNCQFQPDNPDEVTAIFDWDMATLGDPLVDFGVTLGYWPDPRLALDIPVLMRGDWPDKAWLKERYARYTGFDLAEMAWYEALACWKAAIIAQQLYQRYLLGDSADERMAFFGATARAMADLAREIID